MAIRMRLTVNAEPILNEIATLEAFQEVMEIAGQETEDVIKPQFLDEVSYYPPPAKLPFQFGSERSRRWYFAAVNGRIPGVTIPTDGKRYRRTKNMPKYFYVKAAVTDGQFQIVLGARGDKTKWIVGSFDQRRRYQVAGHRNTGWPLIAPTANFWLDAAEEDFLNRIPIVYARYDVKRQNR